jgi:hypothetical protein
VAAWQLGQPLAYISRIPGFALRCQLQYTTAGDTVQADCLDVGLLDQPVLQGLMGAKALWNGKPQATTCAMQDPITVVGVNSLCDAII